MSVSRRLRYEILRRDDHACRYCGARAPSVSLTVDHVLPVALGGADDPSNLVAACKDCNAGKSSVAPDSPIVANVADDALRWAAAMRYAAECQGEDRYVAQCYREYFLEEWQRFRAGEETILPLPTGWEDSVERFMRLGLEAELIDIAVRSAMGSRARGDKVFAYFCGVMWNVYRERQRIAEAHLTQSGGDQ